MYARLENGEIRVYQTLPQSYTFTVEANGLEPGMSTGNFDLMSDAVHKAEGFLPFVIVNDSYNAATQTRDEGTYDVGVDEIRLVYVLTDISPEVLAEKAALFLSMVKSVKQESITQMRDQKVLAGFEYNGVRYDTKEDSLRNINGMMNRVLAVNSFPEGFPGWIAENNDTIEMTVAEFKAFAIAACDYVAALYAIGRAHKNAIEALATTEEVSVYDITAGW